MSPSAALSTGKPMDSHPSYTDTPVSAPRTLSVVGTPLNALGSPYRVITSAMGPPSGALAAPPGINLVAPPSSQVSVLPANVSWAALHRCLGCARPRDRAVSADFPRASGAFVKAPPSRAALENRRCLTVWEAVAQREHPTGSALAGNSAFLRRGADAWRTQSCCSRDLEGGPTPFASL